MTVEWLEAHFNAAKHPRVRTRDKSTDQVFLEFSNGLRSRVPSGVVSEDTWVEYYADVNACLPAEKDEYFIDIALSSWGISQDAFITP